ncbi:MAG: hypothetical protein ACD_19C00014G0036 [uncultured bacterium]|nr:MAG: hypothetical protein ACD_19C00014G0036 [uncultured bacterium]
MTSKKVWDNLVSDLFVNMAAGWFGAVFIVPAFSSITIQSVPLLTIDLMLGILFLRLAFKLRLTE